MNTRRSLLRGVASLALAAAIIGVGASAPTALAAPLDGATTVESVRSPMNKPQVEKPNIPGIGEIPGIGSFGSGQIPNIGSFGNGQIPGIGNGEIPGIGNIGSHDTDIGDIPIIGDVANTFKDAEPEEIVTGAIQFAGVAAETIVPVIVDLATK